MRTIIRPTNFDLDAPARHNLETLLSRGLFRNTSDIELATAYVSMEDEKHHCRLAIQTKAGQNLSAEGMAASHAEALNQAAGHIAAAIQREKMRAHDRHASSTHPHR